MNADDIIRLLRLEPHPEGGHFRETWRAETPADRAAGTAIYFLLAKGETSHWHRVDATEIWHYYAGAPIVLATSADDSGPAVDHWLGPGLDRGERPQIAVPQDHWQMARTTGDWTLVGCTVVPGFRFEGFTLATPGFDIPRRP